MCVKSPLAKAVSGTHHLGMSWVMFGAPAGTWAWDAVWCGQLVTELQALDTLKRIPEFWIILT